MCGRGRPVPLDTEMTLTRWMETEILNRFKARGAKREKLSDVERRKLETVSKSINQGGLHPQSVARALLDHVMPSGKTFSPVRNLYFEWKAFQIENLPFIESVLPVTEDEERGFNMMLTDWFNLSKDLTWYRDVWKSPARVTGIVLTRVYRNSLEFYKLVEKHRAALSNPAWPLYTFRTYLAAQVESLSGFLQRLVPGNVVSEKADERYEEWYRGKFYSAEMQKKALSRPSENNPVSAASTRAAAERDMTIQGRGEFVFAKELEEPGFNVPVGGVNESKVSEVPKSQLVMPPGMEMC